jgi:hypothetical protein
MERPLKFEAVKTLHMKKEELWTQHSSAEGSMNPRHSRFDFIIKIFIFNLTSHITFTQVNPDIFKMGGRTSPFPNITSTPIGIYHLGTKVSRTDYLIELFFVPVKA